MCEGSGLSAEIEFSKVPKLDFLESYIQQKSMPGGTTRNLDSYGHKVTALSDDQKAVLADPQTSGGLLVAVDHNKANDFEVFTLRQGMMLKPFGKLVDKRTEVVSVKS
jgi:selenide,water dikinase